VAEAPGAGVRTWADGPLERDVEAAIERLARSDGVRRIAVMPDVHCRATYASADRRGGPPRCTNAVGGDIGCGVAALAFDCEAARLDDERAAAAVFRPLPAIRSPGMVEACARLRRSSPVSLSARRPWKR
jgi:tRNA-splicing ligase RtcB